MPKAYSGDLRVRVIEMVRAGASRREAAEVFSLAGSTAVKWLQRWEKSGSAEAKPRGGSVSPLEVHAMVIWRWCGRNRMRRLWNCWSS